MVSSLIKLKKLSTTRRRKERKKEKIENKNKNALLRRQRKKGEKTLENPKKNPEKNLRYILREENKVTHGRYLSVYIYRSYWTDLY